MADTFHLLVVLPGKEPIAYPLTGEKVTLGRSPSNNIQVLIREISTSHCEFIRTDSGFTLHDRGSTNGTRVNDRSVKSEGALLHDRDFVLLGETIPAYFVRVAGEQVSDPAALIASIDKERAAALAQSSPLVRKTAPLPVASTLNSGIPPKPPVAVPSAATSAEAGSSTIKLIKQPGPVTAQLTEGGPTIRKLTPPVKTDEEHAGVKIANLTPPAASPPNLAPPAAKIPSATPPVATPPNLVPPVAKIPSATPPVASPANLVPPAVKIPSATPPTASPPNLVPPAVKIPSATPPVASPPNLVPPAVKIPSATPPTASPPNLVPPVVKIPSATPPPHSPAPVDSVPGSPPPAIKLPAMAPPVKLATQDANPAKKIALPKLNLPPKKEEES